MWPGRSLPYPIIQEFQVQMKQKLLRGDQISHDKEKVIMNHRSMAGETSGAVTAKGLGFKWIQ
jgi:hypothetical protein